VKKMSENVDNYCVKRDVPQPTCDDDSPDRRYSTIYGETEAQRNKDKN